MSELSFTLKQGGRFIISNPAYQQLNKFKQRKRGDKEAGGILLGKMFENKQDLIIDEITTPLKQDKRSRNMFYRSDDHHAIAVEKWEHSDGFCHYLGLWHTHPEKIPSPSSIDLIDWENAINNGRFEGDSLFFIILGTKRLCCWQGVKRASENQKESYKIEINQLKICS